MKTLPVLLVLVLATAALAQKMSPTAAPEGEHLLMSLSAKGVQIYTCKQVDVNVQWVFEAPEATLSNAKGETVGTHVAGPIWKYRDGSQVTAEVVATSAAPVPDSIPWLLLHATNSKGAGLLSRVDAIRRTNTHGGVAPATGCDAEHLNSTARVPYTATYTFYSTKL